MHIVPLAWMFVVVLMAVAEATSSQGSLLGAFFTFVLYGVLPLSIVMYLLGTPMRRRARQKFEAAETTRADAPPDGGHMGVGSGPDGDGSRHSSGEVIHPEREKL